MLAVRGQAAGAASTCITLRWSGMICTVRDQAG